MTLEIPENDLPGILLIAELPDKSVGELVKALSKLTYVRNAQEMTKRIAINAPSIPKDDLILIFDAIDTLYHVREFSGVNSSAFLDDLIEGIFQNIQDKALSKKSNIASYRKKFEKLLNIDALTIAAKATRLQRDGERRYCPSTKILSDIRPVFGSDPTDKPVGAVITHTLKLGYHEKKEGQHQEFHVVLDSEDLDTLLDVINRARAKDKTLRIFLKDSKLSNLGI